MLWGQEGGKGSFAFCGVLLLGCLGGFEVEEVFLFFSLPQLLHLPETTGQMHLLMNY